MRIAFYRSEPQNSTENNIQLKRRKNMKKNPVTKKVLVITLISLMVLGGTAFAYRQKGESNGKGSDCYQNGPYKGHGGYGYGQMMAGLSEEDQAKVNELRQKHFEAMAPLRSERESKRLALRSELAKQNPDAQVAVQLQEELSAINAELGRERIKHVIEMKKINPNAGGRGFMMGADDNRGRGGSRGYGRDCPRW